jgi:hypothetical protein
MKKSFSISVWTGLLAGICILLLLISGYLMIDGKRGIAFALIGATSVLVAWYPVRRKVTPLSLLPAVLLVTFYAYRSGILAKTGPSGDLPTFDIYTLFVDSTFGFQPSVWVRQVIAHSHAVEVLLQNIYEGLPAALGIAYALNLASDKRRWRVFALLLLTAVIGAQCYRLLPVCGPAYLPFGDECFYYHGSCSTSFFFHGTPYMVGIDSRFPRNGMPSLHMSWALIVWWVCLGRKNARWVALAFVVLTALSTLAYGEHYLVDLAAAFPFSVALWFLCMGEVPFSDPKRVMPVAMGVFGYLSWVFLIRFSPDVFSHSPIVPWGALIVSCAGSLFLVMSSQNPSRAISPNCCPSLPARAE